MGVSNRVHRWRGITAVIKVGLEIVYDAGKTRGDEIPLGALEDGLRFFEEALDHQIGLTSTLHHGTDGARVIARNILGKQLSSNELDTELRLYRDMLASMGHIGRFNHSEHDAVGRLLSFFVALDARVEETAYEQVVGCNNDDE